MNRVKKILWYWVPPFIWMGLIFYLSSRSSISVTKTFIINFMIFKTLHIIEYAILYFLWFRAFYFQTRFIPIRKKILYPFFISLFYAISDEAHQLFIPTREATIRDVFIDLIGITSMYYYITIHLKTVKKILI